MSSPILWFAHTRPIWLTIASTLALAFMAGVFVTACVFIFFYLRWKNRALVLESKGELDQAWETIRTLEGKIQARNARLKVYQTSHRTITAAIGIVNDKEDL